MKDGVLQLVSSCAELNPPLEQDVTLMVGGFLVSGCVVGYAEYMKHHPITEKLWEKEEQWAAEHPTEVVEQESSFLHLRDARFYAPGQMLIPSNGGVYFRVSRDAIQGFNFGTLSIG